MGAVMHHKSLYEFPLESNSNYQGQRAKVWVVFHTPAERKRHIIRELDLASKLNWRNCGHWATHAPELYGMLRRMPLQWFHRNTEHRGLSIASLSKSGPNCGSAFPFLLVRLEHQCKCAMPPRRGQPHHWWVAIGQVWVMIQQQLDYIQYK